MVRLLPLLMALSLSGSAAEVVDTCLVQSKFVRVTIAPSTPGVNGAPDCPGCSQYKVCLTLHGMVDKANGISHTCVKSPSACPPLGFDSYTAVSSSTAPGIASGKDSPAANDVPQCQYGQAGTAVYFLLKDGNSCQPSDVSLDYVQSTLTATDPLGKNVTVNAECRSRKGWSNNGQVIPSCTGNSEEKECVWKVQLPGPDCGAAPSPGASASPGASPSPGAPALPKAAPSPSPEKVAADEIDCLACKLKEEPQCTDVDIKYADKPTAVIPNCDFDVLLGALKQYRCEAVEGCDTMVCQDRIPDGVLEKAYQVCQPAV